MAKNKAELQSDAAHYRLALSKMRDSHAQGDVLAAIEIAMAACEYVDGMMQFERRFEQRTDRKSVETIDYVLQYAPVVFDQSSLAKIATLLKTQKRIDKNATADLAQNVQSSIETMWDAHQLWNELVGHDV